MAKRAQSLFGMPFSVIFSIFLIAIFLVVAFFAIKYFLNIGKCSETGMFIDDFKSQIDEAIKSESLIVADPPFTRTLSSNIEYVCFADLQESATGTAKEKQIYAELKKNADYTANLFFYPRKNACIPSTNVEYVNFTTNPYCFEVKDGKVQIKIEKGFLDSSVRVSR